MGWLRPQTLAKMRGIKAEGGWGVVRTEYCAIHPASDDLSGVSAAIRDEDDIRAHALMTERAHEQGGLAGCERWFGGRRNPNAYSRLPIMDLESVPCGVGHPWQTRATDRTDSADLRPGTARRRCGLRPRASTSSMSTRRMPICLRTSSIRR
jgi:dimethylamine/trimethylamine dehydrogenase